jgi:hypothetical protein
LRSKHEKIKRGAKNKSPKAKNHHQKTTPNKPLQHPLKNRTDGGWGREKGKRAEKQAAQGIAGKMAAVENFVYCEWLFKTSTKTNRLAIAYDNTYPIVIGYVGHLLFILVFKVLFF